MLEALERGRQALSPPEILARARETVPTLNLSTVYRQITGLLDEDLVAAVVLPGQPTRYEPACEQAHDDPGHHHHHFHCTVCNRVYALHACPGPMQDLVPRGFKVESHELTLHGRCADCRRGAHA